MASHRPQNGAHAQQSVRDASHDTRWRAVINQVTWMVCRKFQFQCFNFIDDKSKGVLKVAEAKKCTPATAYVVSDHLAQLIITDAMSREGGATSDQDRLFEASKASFGNAVWRLHVTIFTPYEDWAVHQRFDAFSHKDKGGKSVPDLSTSDTGAILAGILDLAMYFCLWTEAANLRHMPESLWFFFWAMQRSSHFQQLAAQLKEEVYGKYIMQEAFGYDSSGRPAPMVYLAERRHYLRNEYFNLINRITAGFGKKVPFNVDSNNQHPRNTFDALTLATPAFDDPSISWNDINWQGIRTTDRSILWEFALFGDGGEFMRRIVTPVFRALAYEVATKGGKGVEPAMRITYDDANESFVVPTNIARILKALDVSLNEPQHLFFQLWTLGNSNAGWSTNQAATRYSGKNRDYDKMKQDPPWLLKTFQERRTWLAMYLAYFRIFAFHILWFHVLLGLAFAQNSDFKSRWWVGISSAVLTHAVLELLYNIALVHVRRKVPAPPAGSMDVRRVVSDHSTYIGSVFALLCCCMPMVVKRCVGLQRYRDLTSHEDQEKPNELWKVIRMSRVAAGVNSNVGSMVKLVWWMVAVIALTFLFIAQFSWFPWPEEDPDEEDPLQINSKDPAKFFKDLWPVVAAIYGAVAVVLWGPLTMRDGYTVTFSSLIDKWKACWGGCWQSSRHFLGGEYIGTVPPKVGWGQFLRNVLFWTFVLGCKFALDYFLVIKQMTLPIKGLLKQNWLGTCGDDLVISDTSVPCVENMLLVVALCFPVFLVVLFDTGILYQVGVFVYGCSHGLVRLGLGQVVTWNDLVKQFELGVTNFNAKLLSQKGQAAWKDPLKIRMYISRAFASTGSDATDKLLPDVSSLSQEQAAEYQKWTPFADAWDTIVQDLRKSDLISNDEELNLKFNAIHFLRKHDLKPHVLPVCFFAGKIQRALDDGAVDSLSSGVLTVAYRLFLALITEIGLLQESVQEHLKQPLLVNSPQNYYHSAVRRNMVAGIRDIITALLNFKEGAKATDTRDKLVSTFTALIRNVQIELKYSQMVFTSAEKLEMVERQIGALEAVIRGEHSDSEHTMMILPGGASKAGIRDNSHLDRTLNALLLKDDDPSLAQNSTPVREIRALLNVLNRAISLTDQEAEPKNEEASRVLKFFMSSLLNNTMKVPESIQTLRSLTTLVPHYAEGVIYPLDADEVHTYTDVKPGPKDDMNDILVNIHPDLSMSTIDFLRIQFRDEWDNFVQRMWGKYGIKDPVPDNFSERYFQQSKNGLFHDNKEARMDLMLWASERGQMLSRTVKGMMMYRSALEQWALLETAGATNVESVQSLVDAKFRHVVTSQVYGAKKNSGKAADKWLAASVDHLMKTYPALRIAYLDTAKSIEPSGKGTPMSVLLRWNEEKKEVEEVYRVQLPDQREDGKGVVLGEGKPENQNHAMIFCFGECVQTVDMNQENRHAEALKMRNLLQEFAPRNDAPAAGPMVVGEYRNALQAATRKEPIVALVGFREWIFSGKAGMLGRFAAGAEFAFGTIVQRTMAEPNACRFHYGHPDVWNKLYTITRGGVSKATRAFHVSEDVFGGYNAIFRGAVIKYKEYMSVGKARDVGFSQINGFEAKVAGGNGEQSISRDVYRLGTRLDWFRLMSWYHSGLGFFMNSALTMASVYVAVWLVFVFALTDSLTTRFGSGDRANGLNDDVVVISTINTVQLFQLGLLSIIPYWGELSLETGFLQGTGSIIRQMLSGGLLFFIFRQQTSAYYFTQIAYYGGAKYIATGRGFDLKHMPYVETFTSYGRSHMYFGFQLMSLAVMLAFLDIKNYTLSTWGTWLVAVSLMFAPFWFNPATFRVHTVRHDFDSWRQWMTGSTDMKTKQSWTLFHRSQMEKARNIEGKQTDHGWNRMAGVLMQAFNIVILIALGERIMRPDKKVVNDIETDEDDEESQNRKITGFIVFELALFGLLAMVAVAHAVRTRGGNMRRYVTIAFGVALIVLFVLYLTYVGKDVSAGFVDIVLLVFANMTAAIIAVQLALYLAPFQRWSILLVDMGYYAGDTAIGLVVFSVLFLLSFAQFFDSLQALLLFSSELLTESRRGQALQLYDAKRGELVTSGDDDSKKQKQDPVQPQSPAPQPPRSDAHRLSPHSALYGTFSAQAQEMTGLGGARRRPHV